MDNQLRIRKKTVDTTPIVDVKEVKEKSWDDQLEAIQYTTRVFAELDKQLGTDLVLARLEPSQREFIQNQVKYAISLKKQIPDSAVANRVFLTIITEVLMMAILHRNVDRNVLLEIIGGVHDKGEEFGPVPGGQQTVGGWVKDKLPFGKKGAEME